MVEEISMEKCKNRIVVSVMAAIMLMVCVSCAANGVDEEPEGQSRENVSRDDGASNMQGDDIEPEDDNPFDHGEFPETARFTLRRILLMGKA